MAEATRWRGGYWFDGVQRTFETEGEAVAWAASALLEKPWLKSLAVGEDVPQLSGGSYARPKKVVTVFPDGSVDVFFASAVCG
jgi:hypothetical protein